MKIFKVLPLITGLLLAIIVFQIGEIRISKKEIFKSCQPASIDYKSFGPYCLMIKTEKQILSSKLIIVIAKQMDENGVFHTLDYPYNITEAEAKNLSILWTENGVEIIDQVGFKMEIPKAKFIGGR